MLVLAAIVAAVVVAAGCVDQGGIGAGCQTPFITVGAGCCLDENNNSVCDPGEQQMSSYYAQRMSSPLKIVVVPNCNNCTNCSVCPVNVFSFSGIVGDQSFAVLKDGVNEYKGGNALIIFDCTEEISFELFGSNGSASCLTGQSRTTILSTEIGKAAYYYIPAEHGGVLDNLCIHISDAGRNITCSVDVNERAA
jgi:hypothetical protein